jgi:hypothetical protein
LVKRRVKGNCRLGFRVRIDDGFLDQRVKPARSDSTAQGLDVSVGAGVRAVSLADP